MKLRSIVAVLGATLLGLGFAVVPGSAQQLRTPGARLPIAGAGLNPAVSSYRRGVRTEENRRELIIRRLDVSATIRGAIAETEIDIAFAARKGDDASEAWFHLDLPKGAIVTGYALDIDGAMIDGVLVDQPKARAVYEAKVRQGIDPGIGEVDRTGGFNVRVFPVDSVKGRRIRLRFVAPVGPDFTVPIAVPATTGAWSVQVNGLTDGAGAALGDRWLAVAGSIGRADGTGALRTALRLRPQTNAASTSRHPTTGELFWQVSGTLPGTERPTGGTMRVYWDRSRSMREIERGMILTQVRNSIASLRPQSIELVDYNSQRATRTVVADFEALQARVRTFRYAGASGYAALANDAAVDTCLLVSDGRVTLGDSAAFMPPCRLIALPAGEQADRAALAALAERNGGFLVDPRRALNWRASRVERVIDAAGRSLEFTALPTTGGQYRVAVANPSASPLRIVVGGQVKPAPTPTAAATAAFAGEAVLLASRRLAALEGNADRDAFVALSRRYSVASETLSFIVLETVDDYVQADIDPPATYPQLAEYRVRKAAAAKGLAEQKSGRFDALLIAWRDEVLWWETKFDPYARPPKAAEPRRNTGGDNMVLPAPMSAPPPPPGTQRCPDGSVIRSADRCPPPPPPPPPPPEPERDGPDDAADAIVTTGTRIARPNLEAPSPVTTVSAEQFDLTGSVTVETLLNDLPQLIPGNSRTSTAEILPSARQADRAYLKAFDRDPAAFDRLFAEWEDKAGGAPIFYFDVADWLHAKGRRAKAVETLLSALDLPSANGVTMGIVAARLQRWGEHDLAIALRERQLLAESDRPQVRRLLALAVAARATANSATARADYACAIAMLVEFALSPVEPQWQGIDIIALREANALIPRLVALGGSVDLDPRLVKNLDSDLRIVIDWSTDDTDLDLWVDQPNGERAIYNHPRTIIGGRLSNDMTNGYGPEEYWLRNAPIGTFRVSTNSYRSDRIDPNGKPRLHLRLIRDFGRPTEREDAVDLEMGGEVKSSEIGRVTIGARR